MAWRWYNNRGLVEMQIEDLRNYGRGLMDSVPDPKGLQRWKEISAAMQEELRRELGVSGVERLNAETARHTEMMKAYVWSILKEHGLVNESYIVKIIERIAMMKALADMVGMDKATEIQCRLLDMSMYDLMKPIFPAAEDYEACGNYFHAFREYSKASYAANVRAGLHELEIIEDTPRVLAFNITYCAWHEVSKAFGDPYLCYPSTCYGDDAYIGKSLAGSGCRWKRTGTLATGAPVCDFVFEYDRGGDS